MSRKIKGVLFLEPQATAPAEIEGTVYYDSDDSTFKVYNGTEWEDFT